MAAVRRKASGGVPMVGDIRGKRQVVGVTTHPIVGEPIYAVRTGQKITWITQAGWEKLPGVKGHTRVRKPVAGTTSVQAHHHFEHPGMVWLSLESTSPGFNFALVRLAPLAVGYSGEGTNLMQNYPCLAIYTDSFTGAIVAGTWVRGHFHLTLADEVTHLQEGFDCFFEHALDLVKALRAGWEGQEPRKLKRAPRTPKNAPREPEATIATPQPAEAVVLPWTPPGEA